MAKANPTKSAKSAKSAAASVRSGGKSAKPDATVATESAAVQKTAVQKTDVQKTTAQEAAAAQQAASDTFRTRLARHAAELEELFMGLYGDHAAYERLLAAMEQAATDRPADLQALDAAREQDPDWYKRGDMFGMTMYTDLFAGDLRKLSDRIDYLKEQKLTYLHLMPLLKMPHPNNDGGYAVEDFDQVDPQLGSNEDPSVGGHRDGQAPQGV